MPVAGPTSLPDIGLLRGTSPQFADETKELLRNRLFGAALAVAGILGFAFVGNILLGNSELWWLRVAFLLAMGAALFALRKPGVSNFQLRLLELLIFGVFYFQLSMMMVARLVSYADVPDVGSVAAVRFGYLAAFCVLILAYGIFVPNNWKRGSLVMIPMAVLPYLICRIVAAMDANVASAFGDIAYKSPIPITAMAAVVGICGAYTIYSVRKEAFKAKRLGQYRLGQQLGEGGMGQVFRAEHMLLKRPCAIKLIHPDVEVTTATIEGFEREVKATAKLTHWNTVEIYDYGRTSDGTFYYVMELLDGCNLAELVDRFGPLTPARAVFLLKQMCEALDEAHSMNLIHRDLKPQNIFVSRLGNKYDIIKLLDFGLVKIQTSSGRETSTDSNKRSFCGTPLFMPPGQVTSYDQVDGRSDIYALGCLAYFMVTGRPPFLGKKTNEVLTAHAVEPVVPPSSINSNTSGQLDAAILKCLEKLPVDRFQNVGELAKAVGACEFPKDWTDDLAKQWWSTVGVNLKLSDIEVFRRTSAESATVLMPELDHQVDGI